jgi:hypothetical protein
MSPAIHRPGIDHDQVLRTIAPFLGQPPSDFTGYLLIGQRNPFGDDPGFSILGAAPDQMALAGHVVQVLQSLAEELAGQPGAYKLSHELTVCLHTLLEPPAGQEPPQPRNGDGH